MKFTTIPRAAALASVLVLAACGGAASDSDTDIDGDGEISQGEVEAAVASAKITPGQWENTVEFVEVKLDESKFPPEMQGMIGPALEGMKGQVRTAKSCVSEEEASNPEAEMFSGNENADCEYDRFDFAGGKMNMAMTCEDPSSGTVKIVSEGTYTDQSYNMEMTVNLVNEKMGAMTISATSTGKYLGACPAG